ncbi:ribosome-associated translation inhibitor RaiA [Paracoccaceae bacterium]|nr:ribosome-associated translation inhibitor RaiA [Paracoccaceae bacterium]
MNIKIVGRNIELGKSFQAYSSTRIDEVLQKYSYEAVSAQITLEKRVGNFKAKVKVYLKNKIELDSTGRGRDANNSYDDALDHIEKKLRRYHRRMKSHRNSDSKNILSSDEPLRIYQSALNTDEDEIDINHSDSMPVVAELSYKIEELTVEQAVMRLELENESCIFFRNASHSGLNLVYYRKDGNIGWVDPRGSREKTIVKRFNS